MLVTLEQALDSQRDLAALCADRELKTKEIHRGNAFYGSDWVLKRFAGLPGRYPLKMVVPHGPYFSEDHVWEPERDAELPIVLCFPEYRVNAYRKVTNKVIVPSTSPFVYLTKMIAKPLSRERRGTIFFPAHSTHWITASMDFEALADDLLNLGREYHPIRVCIYWRDFNLGHHRAFVDRGFEIVSAGHMYDPSFMSRLYHLFSVHRYAASNEQGSQIYYSLAAGCSFFFHGSVSVELLAEESVLKRDGAVPSPSRVARLRAAFCEPTPVASREQLAIASQYLGMEHMRSSRELRKLILLAEALDKTRVVVRDPGRGHSIALPPFFRRGLRKLGRVRQRAM